MAEAHVVSALKRKYAYLKGDLAEIVTWDPPEKVMHDLAMVGAVLHMFDPSADLAAIKPRRAYRQDRQKWARLAVTILKVDARPMSPRALARRIICYRRMDHGNARLVSRIECALHATLAAWEGHGIERVCDHPKRWAVADS